MRLIKFSVERYRSITQKSTLEIGDKTVIIGPNNEGKSNVLRALIVALRVLEAFSTPPYLTTDPISIYYVFHYLKRRRDISFEWEKDYPHSLLYSNPGENNKKPISFCLDFKLTDKEQTEFLAQTNIKKVSDVISVAISIFVDKVSVVVYIEHHNFLDKQNIIEVSSFITKHIDICYIDAIRTASTARESIRRLLSIENTGIYASSQYQECIHIIEKLYSEKFGEISKQVTESLKKFVPSISEAMIELPRDHYDGLSFIDIRGNVNVSVNDGEITPLEQKGSGIQSLIALALAHSMSIKPSDTKSFILAIEEPEAHLHPKAIHEIKSVLSDIASRNQLVITTHSPLLTNTQDVESNIIVSDNIAHPATSLKQIREALGVLASDNLLFADNTVLVEGLSDKLILEKILAAISSKIDIALREGTLKIYNCQGASKISAFASIIKGFICRYYIVLDNDKAGQDERNNLVSNNPDLSRSITCFATTDMKESEIEDFIIPEIYVDELIKMFGFGNRNSWLNVLNGSYKSWSDRLNVFATGNGHPVNKAEMIQAKTIVANAVVEKGISALRTCRRDIFDTLAANIEKMLDE